MHIDQNRLMIVSNRLPLRVSRDGQGNWQIARGTGGLVTALEPLLRRNGGIWVGWPGITEEDSDAQAEDAMQSAWSGSGYQILPVSLTRSEHREFYEGFSNEIIWPIFHDLQTLCNFDPKYWKAYLNVNRKFAAVIRDHTASGDYVWVHDYHLMAVASEMRKLGIEGPIGFFLHIPFPSLDIFLKIPWRLSILTALFAFDLVGFQTERDRRNFVQCVRALVPKSSVRGRGRVFDIRLENRVVRIGRFPISIDYNDFASRASSREVADSAWYIHENIPKRKILLGIDRLDHTKGIPYRLDAFRTLLKEHPELREKISLVQVVVPSRTGVPKYQDLRAEIERLVGEINGQFTQSGWIPVHYIFRALNPVELLGYYRASEIALITPLKDGMNLIAKEYCAAKTDNDGVLILSEFAGASSQLQNGAILVNPYHIEEVAGAIHRAFLMEPHERKRRMQRLRRAIRRQDVFWWVSSFLEAAVAKDWRDIPDGEHVPETVASRGSEGLP